MQTLTNRLAAFTAVLVLLSVAMVATPAAAKDGALEGVVNINDASQKQLVLLPGIGMAKAKAIMEQRKAGRFTSANDLTKVRGISKKLVDKIRDYVVTKGKTTARAPAKKAGKKKRAK